MQNYNNTVNLRKKFNTALEDAITGANNPRIIHTSSILQLSQDFDFTGELTDAGKKIFWQHIDDQFDIGKINLQPQSHKHENRSNAYTKHINNFNFFPGRR